MVDTTIVAKEIPGMVNDIWGWSMMNYIYWFLKRIQVLQRKNLGLLTIDDECFVAVVYIGMMNGL